MVCGFDDQAGLPIPAARAAVEQRRRVRVGSLELVPQQVGKEMVVAVPVAFAVERHQ